MTSTINDIKDEEIDKLMDVMMRGAAPDRETELEAFLAARGSPKLSGIGTITRLLSSLGAGLSSVCSESLVSFVVWRFVGLVIVSRCLLLAHMLSHPCVDHM